MKLSKRQVDLFRTAVPLTILDRQRMPVGRSASCCIVKSSERWYVVSVRHAVVQKDGQACVNVSTDLAQHGTWFYAIPQWHFLRIMHLTSGENRDMDVCYAPVPESLNPTIALIDESDGRVQSIPCRKLICPSKVPLTPRRRYGFGGGIKPTLAMRDLLRTSCVYDNLQYVRQENEVIVFRLPFEHPGPEFFRGCSGAPILSKDGIAVAIVCGGDTASDEIHAISFDFVANALLVEGHLSSS